MAKAKKGLKKSAKKAPTKKVAVKRTVAPKIVQKSAKKLTTHIQPLGDRIVVELEGPSDRTAGGLYIPQTASERPNKGLVLAVGRGGKTKRGHLKPLDVKEGDFILFNNYAGVPTNLDGKEVLILQESEVLGVVSK